VAAHDVVHARRARGRALLLRLRATRAAALWLVDQALLLVEVLLAGGPHEGLAAVAAAQLLVREAHRPCSPRAGWRDGQASRAVFSIPSRRSVRGRQKPSRAALLMSRHERWTSLARGGSRRIACGGPRTALIVATRSFTDVATPVPML